MSKIEGFHVGVVIQNDDPDKMGRVKIYIPHLSTTVYENLNNIKDKDLKFTELGKNIESDLSPILETLKANLPWANCAAPLIGANSLGKYNAKSDLYGKSDSHRFVQTHENQDAQKNQLSFNSSGLGESSSVLYEKHPITDEFTLDSENIQRVNPNSEEYLPSSYSNSCKGSFSIPNVGSHVWVFFYQGNPMFPIYFATTYGKSDFLSVFGSDDNYPDIYENYSEADRKESDYSTETYKNKYVFAQKGGTIEIINTDGKERFTTGHPNGSFYRFSNKTTSEFNTENKQSLTLKDAFATIKGFYNEYIGKNADYNIKGKVTKKIGSLNRKAALDWLEKYRPINELIRLFEIKRAPAIIRSTYNKTSIHQTKSGNHALCPVCSGAGKKKYWVVRNQTNSIDYTGGEDNGLTITNSENYGNASDVYSSTIIPAQYVGPQQPAQEINDGGGGTMFEETCSTCNGTGLSPSSKNGLWNPETKKQEIATKLKELISDLSDLEAQLGEGDEIITTTKNKIEAVGMVMTDLGAFRVDEKGKIGIVKVDIAPKGVYESEKEIPLIEYVNVDPVPFGNYTFTAGHSYNVLIGSGGGSIKTFGNFDISAAIFNITGEQVNISSVNEVNINGGKSLNLQADILKIKPKDQAVVDGGLGITKNLIVGGGAHVEGELSVQHVTAPIEIQETERSVVYGETYERKQIGIIRAGTIVIGNTKNDNTKLEFKEDVPIYADVHDKDCIKLYPHSHNFANLPLRLTEKNDDVRKLASENNDNSKRLEAEPRDNSKKSPGITA